MTEYGSGCFVEASYTDPLGMTRLFCRNGLLADGKGSDKPFAGVAQDGEGVRLFKVIFESRAFQWFLGHFLEAPEMVLGDADTLGGGEIRAAVGTRDGCHRCSFNQVNVEKCTRSERRCMP